VETNPEQAKKEKITSRTSLERGKLADAIEAGERSVALDPTDGEAWLILGAAYQQKGNSKEARRCYKACVEQGKRGPRGECGAMLR
jgi:Flp pilus assembly protein TadD